jgi:hypothetical protein
MRMRFGIFVLVCAAGLTNGALAQEQTNTQPAVDLTNRSPQVAVLTDQFHMLDVRASSPTEIAPPGTINDDSEMSDDRIATDMPRSLLTH